MFTKYMTNTATANTASPTERHALTELVKLMDEAKGNHEMLADVRKQAAAEIDALCNVLAQAGVDTDALLDEIDAELGL